MILDIRSVRANMEAFARYRIRPRILVNVDKVDMSVDFCGYKVRPSSLLSDLGSCLTPPSHDLILSAHSRSDSRLPRFKKWHIPTAKRERLERRRWLAYP
jgi:hypothetical protein